MPEIHKKIVDEIIGEESIKPDTIAINLFGSLAKGNERPNYDVDIQIISKEDKSWSLENKEKYGIKIDFEVCPAKKLIERAEKYPFLCYIYLNSKVIYDPNGFMNEILEDIRGYFRENPKITE